VILTGIAALRRDGRGWVAGPGSDGVPQEGLPPHHWWLDVPRAVLPADVSALEGLEVRVEVRVATPCPWDDATPSGPVGVVDRIVGEPQRPEFPEEFAPDRHVRFAVPADLDARVAEAVDRIPPSWPVLELTGTRPERAGWHTLIRTLGPVDDGPSWRRGVSPTWLRVEPWLSRGS
jgi:hypothetical protein